ncbi:phosphatase domain-containing protein [Melittangium boletus]|nr:phosphatase domain-containing protein [Melittangium boletus]
MPRPSTPARLSALLLCLATSSALAAPAVLLFPTLGRPDSVTLQGRVLADTPHGSTALTRNLRRLATANWKGARVELSFLGVSAHVTSGADGNFQVTLPAPADKPFPVGNHPAQASVPGASTQAPVEIIPDSAPFLVVSDFDDTLAISEVTQPDKLVTNALLRDADTQQVVSGMAGFYGCLGADATRVPAFALVSGSPVQFAPRVGAFLSRHGFPSGFGLYLRDLGPGTLSDYKQPIIRGLLQRFPHPVVLVGDSGEKDPEVYAQIRDEFPGRVRAIYIRDAGNSANATRFKDMLLFKDASTAAEHAARQGFARSECVSAAFAPVAPTQARDLP